MTTRDPTGRYAGLAGLAFDRVATFKYAEHVKLEVDKAMHVTNERIRLESRDTGQVFQKLIRLAETLHEHGFIGKPAFIFARYM